MQGIRRTLLKDEAGSVLTDDAEPGMVILRWVMYPDIASSIIEAEGVTLPLTFEAFTDLDDDLVFRLERATYELNPHWLPGGTAEEQKKSESEQPTG